MVYIPKEWVKDSDNTDTIHRLLSKLDQDIVSDFDTTKESVISKLKEIDEVIIIEKLENGDIPFGA